MYENVIFVVLCCIMTTILFAFLLEFYNKDGEKLIIASTILFIILQLMVIVGKFLGEI